MKRISLIFFFIYMVMNSINGQVNVSKYDHEGEFGTSGLKFCVRGGKCGYINTEGIAIVPISYDYEQGDYNVYKQGYYPLDKKYGYWETWNNHTILVRLRKNGKYGFVNHKGEVIIPFKYDMIYDWDFSRYDALLRARIGNSYGLIDVNGREIVPVKYKNTGQCEYGEPTWVQREDGKIAYVNSDGSFITDFKYTKASEYFFGGDNEVAHVAINDLWGFVDKSGREVVSPKYTYADSWVSEEGWVSVVKNGKLGFIDLNENIVIPFQYDVVTGGSNSLESRFKFGVANVRKNGKWALIDKNGKAITAFKYDKCNDTPHMWYKIDMPMCEAKIGVKTVYLDILGNEYSTTEELNKSAYSILTKAANMGIPVAAYCLSENFEKGNGVVKDSVRAFEWCKKAVELGYASAEYELAKKYYYGQGCVENYEDAYRLMKSAADRGKTAAYLFLGYMFYYGQGTEKNYENAFSYFYKSSCSGNERQSQYYLGWLYEHGQGVPTNIEEAKKWYAQSSFQGYEPAKERLSIVLGKKDNMVDLVNNNVASMTWLVYEPITKQKEYSFKIGVKSNSKIEDVSVYVNGVLTRGIIPVHNDGFNMTIGRTVALNDGQNTIKVMVKNAGGTATTEKTVTYQNQGIATIDWLAFSPTTTEKQFALKAGIKSTSKIESWTVSVNGVVDRGINPVKNDGYTLTIDKMLTLSEGSNTVMIEVRNAGGIAMAEKSVIYSPKKATPIVQQKRIALVMGNANYRDIDKRLKNPVNDATDVAAKLESLGFTVIRSLDQTQQGMEAAINNFGSQARNYDVALFYYAGHGVRCNGSNYLIPVDANLPEESYVQYKCTNANLVLDLMNRAHCQMKIVILDACRNNPFARSWTRSTDGGGLNIMNAPKGTFIAFSTAPGDVAQDGAGRNSPYTAALLQTLDIPNLSITDFFQEVLERVALKTNDRQTPWTSNSFRGKFIFNQK